MSRQILYSFLFLLISAGFWSACSEEEDALASVREFHRNVIFTENPRPKIPPASDSLLFFLDISENMYGKYKAAAPLINLIYDDLSRRPMRRFTFADKINEVLDFQGIDSISPPFYQTKINRLKTVLRRAADYPGRSLVLSSFAFRPEASSSYRALNRAGDSLQIGENPYPWAGEILADFFAAGRQLEVLSVKTSVGDLYFLHFGAAGQKTDYLSRQKEENIPSDSVAVFRFFSPYSSLPDLAALHPEIGEAAPGIYPLDFSSDPGRRATFYRLSTENLKEALEGKDAVADRLIFNALELNPDTLHYPGANLKFELSDLSEAYGFYTETRSTTNEEPRIDSETGDTLSAVSDIGFRFTGGRLRAGLLRTDFDPAGGQIAVRALSDFPPAVRQKTDLFLLTLTWEQTDFQENVAEKFFLSSAHSAGFRFTPLYESIRLGLKKAGESEAGKALHYLYFRPEE